MLAAGIIVEFNPFHNGHAVHIAETRELTGRDAIIAVTSGNFVQRGEPALCDKWRRTKMALKAGVDIVIELPVPYVISGADYFARGSVGLLAATGAVDTLCFGSESGDISAIQAAGRVLATEPPLYKEVLRAKLDRGLSFAAAQGAALDRCFAENNTNLPEGLLTKPNNGLAMEYCKALELLGNPMRVFTTHRTKGGPSATKIRRAFRNGESIEQYVPTFAKQILMSAWAEGELAAMDDFSDIFRYLVYKEGTSSLGEGLENRFRRLCGGFTRISDLLSAVKTKRYTYTRLQRAVIGMILGISPQDMDFYEHNGGVQYIRVLGFRRESAALLGEITRKATLPVLTYGAAMDNLLSSGGAAAKMLKKDLEAGDIYRLATLAGGGYRSERGISVVTM